MKLSLLLICILALGLVEGRVLIPEYLQKLLKGGSGTEAPPVTTDNSCPECVYIEERPCSERAEGCILRNGFGIRQWYPDPCTLCDCYGCSKIKCPILECFGYPSVTKPGHCCPECDFGVPDNNCSAIPFKIKSLYVSLGDESCQSDVVMHDCNMRYKTDPDGRSFRCAPVLSNIHHKMGKKCLDRTGIHHVVYKDVTECVQEDVDSVPPEEEMELIVNRFPQDVIVGGDKGGLPPRCIEYFAGQQES